MNVGIGNEATQFHLWKYLFRFFDIVSLPCDQQQQSIRDLKLRSLGMQKSNSLSFMASELAFTTLKIASVTPASASGSSRSSKAPYRASMTQERASMAQERASMVLEQCSKAAEWAFTASVRAQWLHGSLCPLHWDSHNSWLAGEPHGYRLAFIPPGWAIRLQDGPFCPRKSLSVCKRSSWARECVFRHT
jgi:hypothetical protein